VTGLPTPSRSFLCLRHGVTDWNAQGRFQGRTDIPLNDEGISQADAAALRLRNVRIDHVVASPLVRAARTAEIAASSLAAPLAIDDRLIECDFGSLEGRSIAEMMKERGLTAMEQLATILPSDGEAWALVTARALRCVADWLDRHPQATILFVCHDAVMQAMSEALCRSWFKNQYGTPFRFERADDVWTVDELD
jgi:broad specificity phosphatase PhoE